MNPMRQWLAAVRPGPTPGGTVILRMQADPDLPAFGSLSTGTGWCGSRGTSALNRSLKLNDLFALSFNELRNRAMHLTQVTSIG